MSENVFAKAAKKSTEKMTVAAKPKTKKRNSPSSDAESLVGVSFRLPKHLHKAILQHRVDTSESGNALIIRLLEEEFKNLN